MAISGFVIFIIYPLFTWQSFVPPLDRSKLKHLSVTDEIKGKSFVSNCFLFLPSQTIHVYPFRRLSESKRRGAVRNKNSIFLRLTWQIFWRGSAIICQNYTCYKCEWIQRNKNSQVIRRRQLYISNIIYEVNFSFEWNFFPINCFDVTWQLAVLTGQVNWKVLVGLFT